MTISGISTQQQQLSMTPQNNTPFPSVSFERESGTKRWEVRVSCFGVGESKKNKNITIFPTQQNIDCVARVFDTLRIYLTYLFYT